MTESNESPILDFLMSKENLHQVLIILRYAQDIRGRVQEHFWGKLQGAITENRPAELNLRLSCQPDLPSRPDKEFGLDARVEPFDARVQGLQYRIEAAPDYIGVGLRWLPWPAKNRENLCQIKPVRRLRDELEKKRRGDLDSVANDYWLWWEYWERDIYAASDPWSWFAKQSDDGWYRDKAERFWEFVGETHGFVLEANKALTGR